MNTMPVVNYIVPVFSPGSVKLMSIAYALQRSGAHASMFRWKMGILGSIAESQWLWDLFCNCKESVEIKEIGLVQCHSWWFLTVQRSE